MKRLVFKMAMVILAVGSIMVTRTQSASAQVDMSLLKSVVKSCQNDVNSSQYYEQMGFEENSINNDKRFSSDNLVEKCVYYRYHYTLVQSRFPWLISTNEIISGYPGSAFIEILSNASNSSLLDCLVSQDPSSTECNNSLNIFSNDKIADRFINYLHGVNYGVNVSYIYTCPSCTVAHDNILSEKKMRENSIRWFMSLEKPQIRKLMSLLGDDEIAIKNRNEISDESDKAVARYVETRTKVRQQDIDQRRREILGN